MTFRLNLGRQQLAVSFNRKRGRPKKTFIEYTNDFVSQLIKIGTDKRFAGHPASRVLRRLFENRKAHRIFGFNLMAVALLTGVMAPSISAFSANPDGEIMALSPTVVQLTTENTVRVPLDIFNVCQGYSLFHRGVDLNEITGAPVYPLMEGTVKEVGNSRSGYGNLVLIDHGRGFKSLYAHLAKIVAAEGEEVDKNTVIGTVGTTGWATGSHLHLEVYDYGQTFSPLTILPAK